MSTSTDPIGSAMQAAQEQRAAETREREEHLAFLWATYAACLEGRSTPDQTTWLNDAFEELGITPDQVEADRELLNKAREHAGLVATIPQAETVAKDARETLRGAIGKALLAAKAYRTATSHLRGCENARQQTPELARTRPLLWKHLRVEPIEPAASDSRCVTDVKVTDSMIRMVTQFLIRPRGSPAARA